VRAEKNQQTLRKDPKISYKRRSYALDNDDQGVAKAKRAQKIRDENRQFLIQKLRQKILEAGSVLALFNLIDADKNGFVTMKELKLALLRMNFTLIASDFPVYFNEMDTNGDGVVDYSEFVAYMKHPPRSLTFDERCQGVTMVSTRGAPHMFGTADRRVGWEKKRAAITERQLRRKFVDSAFAQSQNQILHSQRLMPPTYGLGMPQGYQRDEHL
jgi:hypothetical protein